MRFDIEGAFSMPMPKRENIAGFLVFALALTAATAAPEAHADMLKEFGASVKREMQITTSQSVSRSIDAATPAPARRAAMGLPSQTDADKATVADKVVGRVMRDASTYSYGAGSAKSALKVQGLPGSGSLPGRGNSLGSTVKQSVSDVAQDTVNDGVRSATSSVMGKVFALFDRDDSPSR